MTVLVIGGVVRIPEVGTNNVQISNVFMVSVLNMFFFLKTFYFYLINVYANVCICYPLQLKKHTHYFVLKKIQN